MPPSPNSMRAKDVAAETSITSFPHDHGTRRRPEPLSSNDQATKRRPRSKRIVEASFRSAGRTLISGSGALQEECALRQGEQNLLQPCNLGRTSSFVPMSAELWSTVWNHREMLVSTTSWRRTFTFGESWMSVCDSSTSDASTGSDSDGWSSFDI